MYDDYLLPWLSISSGDRSDYRSNVVHSEDCLLDHYHLDVRYSCSLPELLDLFASGIGEEDSAGFNSGTDAMDVLPSSRRWRVILLRSAVANWERA
jgi:hypothetical protein